jgi:UrcA family protein
MDRSSINRILGAGRTLAIGTATALVALSAQADAETHRTPANVTSVVVSYGDLNLGTTAGAQALYRRLASAADTACGGERDVAELRRHRGYRACYDQALEDAVEKIDSERLQALHAEHSASHSVG